MRGCILILSNLKPSTAVNNSEKSFLMSSSCLMYGIFSRTRYLPSTAFCIFIAWISIICLLKPCSCFKNVLCSKILNAVCACPLFCITHGLFCLSFFLSFCLTACLSSVYLSVCLLVCLYVCLYVVTFGLSIFLHVWPSVCLSVWIKMM